MCRSYYCTGLIAEAGNTPIEDCSTTKNWLSLRIGVRVGGIKGTPGYQNNLISYYRVCVDRSKGASENEFCPIAEFQLIIFELKCMILNFDNRWRNPFKLISLPHHHRNSYHNNREAWALVLKIKNQDFAPCLRALKERKNRNISELARQ